MPLRQAHEIPKEEIEEAFNNKDNRRVIKKVTSKFYRQIDSHELEDCGTEGLIKCLMYHDNSKQKFTSSLYTFVRWECLRKLNKKKTEIKTISISKLDKDSPGSRCKEDSIAQYENPREQEHNLVLDSLNRINSHDRDILTDYYYNSASLQAIGLKNGYSKETARKKISKALVNLRQAYIEREL